MTILGELFHTRTPEILICIDENGPNNAVRIAELIGMDNSAALKSLKILRDKGYTERVGLDWKLIHNGEVAAAGLYDLEEWMEMMCR
ncbi:winged helix-turn-helix domain-containing protein [Methanomassiliicoccales archaeon LGM-RCC1]|nr:winged helix-turn-helix domain-containing protein [Methanomassiliicoccales archaeon LGM-RCC1]